MARRTRNAPRGNNLDVGLEAVEGELEADLVVALAGAAVRDVVAALLLGDGHHTAGNYGARERSAEQVDILYTLYG